MSLTPYGHTTTHYTTDYTFVSITAGSVALVLGLRCLTGGPEGVDTAVPVIADMVAVIPGIAGIDLDLRSCPSSTHSPLQPL